MNKKKIIIVAIVALAATLGTALIISGSRKNHTSHRPLARQQRTEPPRVPAYMTDEKALQNLKPTLPPEQFFGKAREAYSVVREIPQTIAQLPCYCYCDEGFGHKSLYTCYESDHSAHCAMCVSEALAAYKMQKEEGLSPSQIRERIIQQFGPK